MEKNDFFALFNEFNIDQKVLLDLAYKTGFIKRKRTIEPSDFLHALCIESSNGTVSHNDVAAQLESSSGTCVCKVAIWKKININCIEFLKEVLAIVISNKLQNKDFEGMMIKSSFNRIIVQDSSIIRLPQRLFDFFSGVANSNSRVCNARIQATYDILNEQFISFSIDKYSKNDLEAAPELVLEKGDLTLRDRGYLILDEVQRHIEVGADCIYRYKNKMTLLNCTTEEPINILALLEKNTNIDMEIKLNNKEKSTVRLIAFPVPEDVANNRRMKAKKEKKLHPIRNI